MQLTVHTTTKEYRVMDDTIHVQHTFLFLPILLHIHKIFCLETWVSWRVVDWVSQLNHIGNQTSVIMDDIEDRKDGSTNWDMRKKMVEYAANELYQMDDVWKSLWYAFINICWGKLDPRISSSWKATYICLKGALCITVLGVTRFLK
jgi:hypothetical protein